MRAPLLPDQRLIPSTLDQRIEQASAFAAAGARPGDPNGRAALFIAALTGFFLPGVSAPARARFE